MPTLEYFLWYWIPLRIHQIVILYFMWRCKWELTLNFKNILATKILANRSNVLVQIFSNTFSKNFQWLGVKLDRNFHLVSDPNEDVLFTLWPVPLAKSLLLARYTAQTADIPKLEFPTAGRKCSVSGNWDFRIWLFFSL